MVTGLGVGAGDAGLDGATTIDGAPIGDGATIDTASDDAGLDAITFVDGDSSDPILPVADPGFVPCTFQPCVLGAGGQFCCIGKGTCEGNVSACGKYKEVYCNEPADCPGSKCCIGRNSAEQNNASFRCANDCTSIDGYRVCRTTADCFNTNAECIAVTCLGYTVGTCGGKLPPQCADGG